MAIISENKTQYRRYGSTQFRYAVTYVFITLGVLIFLNIYSSRISQQLYYESKETSMIEKVKLASSQIADLEVLNPASLSAAASQMDGFQVSRLMITDQNGKCVFDSCEDENAVDTYALLPEIVTAMRGNDVFSWKYHDGVMRSCSAAPIYSYGALVGCVYMMEYDQSQGALISSLQRNILTVTVILEAVLIVFSVIYSRAFSIRLRRIMNSMRIIQEGDYSHKVQIGGRDELTFLGNEFNELTERLRTSEKKRRQFVSDASHELKTPLASIKLLSDSILQNDMDMDTIREFVSDIGDEAERLNRMSQKLLDLSRSDNMDADTESEIICVIPTVERVLRMLNRQAEKSSITIIRDYSQDVPILILEDDLYQIIFNLVENGIKYNQPGGTLTVSVRRNEENAILTISDTGMGIPEESLSHIFERFYRVDKARSRKSGGSGLGLAIVRSIIQRNRGTIDVDSVLGEGTSFTLTFPAFDTETTEEDTEAAE